MKKIISVIILLVMASIGASAQWYLFPLEKEKTNKENKTEQKVEPQTEQKANQKAEKPAVPAESLELAAPVTVSEDNREDFFENSDDNEVEEAYSLDIPEEINIAMLLPIQASGKTSSNFLEMYAGGLLALRKLGNQGLKVRLSVYDSVDEDSQITNEILSESDVIIGPVSAQNITKILSRCPEEKRVVSPLEPKVAAMADSSHVVQAPSSWAEQVDALIGWVKEEYIAGDDIVLVKDTVETSFSDQTRYLLSQLKESGLKYKSAYLASDIVPSALGNTRYIVASDRDSFIATAVRQIGIGASKRTGGSSCLYLTSKMRNAKGIDQQYLYKAGAKVTMSYFIDYNDEAVKNFILSYRSLFSDEPAAFAFQGYDTVMYFAKACSEYGRQWYMKLPETGLYKGLQSNFMFEESDKAGQINKAVKRVVYNPDMSTSVK